MGLYPKRLCEALLRVLSLFTTVALPQDPHTAAHERDKVGVRSFCGKQTQSSHLAIAQRLMYVTVLPVVSKLQVHILYEHSRRSSVTIYKAHLSCRTQ